MCSCVPSGSFSTPRHHFRWNFECVSSMNSVQCLLAVSNYFLKQQDSLNISVFIFHIFKWFYAFNKKEMSYEECVRRMMMIQKNSNSTRWFKYDRD